MKLLYLEEDLRFDVFMKMLKQFGFLNPFEDYGEQGLGEALDYALGGFDVMVDLPSVG